MSEKFDTDFEKILYAGLIDYAAKTLNSEEVAPLFKSKSPDERKTIKRAILKKLEMAVKKVGKELSEKDISNPSEIVKNQDDVKKIISEIFKEN